MEGLLAGADVGLGIRINASATILRSFGGRSFISAVFCIDGQRRSAWNRKVWRWTSCPVHQTGRWRLCVTIRAMTSVFSIREFESPQEWSVPLTGTR